MAENALRFNFLASDKASGTFDKLSKKADGLAAKVGRFGKFAGKALVGLGAAMGGLAVAGASMGIKTAASLEQAQIGFATLLGSGKKAQAFLSDLKRFAATTPFELPGLIESSRTLLGVGVNASDAMSILKDFGDTAGAVGIGQEQFQRIMVATSQAIGAGRFMTADLNQIMNNGIPIWTILSKAMGKPVPELRTLASEGKLLTKDVLPLLQKEMRKDYGGAMAKQSKTLSGLWSTFTDTLNIGLASAIQPMIPALKNGLAKATEIAGKALEKLPGVIDVVSTKFGQVRDFVTDKIVPALKTAFGDIGKALPDIDLSKLGKGFAEQAKGWAKSIISGVRTGLDTGDWSGLGKSIGSGIASAVGAAGSFIGKIAVKIGDLLGKVDWLGLGIKVGKLAVPFLVGIAIGLLNFDLLGLIKGLAAHWQEALFAVLAIAFTPAKVIGAVAGLLRKIPIFGPMLAWALLAFKKFANGLVGMVGRALAFMGRAFLEGFRRVFPNIGKKFGEELILFPVRLGDIARLVRRKAIEMMQGLGAAIASRIGAVVAKIGELIAKMLKPFARAAGWLIGRGIQFVAGLVRGISSVIGMVVRAAARVISVLTLPFRRAVSWLVGRGRETVSGLIGGVASRLGAVVAVARRVISAVTAPFRGALGWLVQSGRMILVGLRNGMFASLRNVGSWVKSIGSRIIGAVKSFFGIKSPSTVFAGIGSQLMAGLAKGLIAGNPVALIGKIFGGMPKALNAIVSKGLISIASLPRKALSALGRLGGSALSKLGGAFAGFFGGSGVERWRGVALQALAMAGAPASWIGSLLRRMNQESGGNPKAINLWDSNAAAGTPSMGLMQTIGPTFNAYAGSLRSRGVWDPLANIYAAIRYTIARYGSGPAGWDRAGGYAMGGTITEPIFGVGRSGRKYTFGERGPETVIPGRVRARNGGATVHNHYHFPNYVGDKNDLVRALEDLRRQRRLPKAR